MQVRQLYLEITRACNERCVYCYNDSGHPLVNELGTEAMQQVLSGFAQQGGTSVMFTGGECLMRRDLISLMRHARDSAGISYVALSTNGLLLNKPRGQEALALSDEVDISLDGFASEHNLLRGVACWEQTVEAIRHAASTGVWVHVNACMTASLWDRLDEYLDLFTSLNVRSVKLASIGATGRQETPAELLDGLPGLETMERRLSDVSNARRPALLISQTASRTIHPITPVRDGVAVTPTGGIYPQLGLMNQVWRLGSAFPTWSWDTETLRVYLARMSQVERRGATLIRQGSAVDWWSLIRSELDFTPEAG